MQLTPVKLITEYMKNHHSVEIAKGSTIAFALKGLGAVLSFLLSVYVARILGADGAGVFFLTATLIFISASLGRFGLDNVVIKLVSSYASIGTWNKVKEVFFSSVIMIAVFSGILSIFIYLFADYIAQSVFDKPQLSGPIKWMTIRIFPLSVITIVVESLRGLKKIGLSQMLENIWTPVISITLITVLPMYHHPQGLAMIWGVASVIVMIISLSVWFITMRGHTEKTDTFQFDELLRSGYPLFIVSALNLIIAWSATLFLGIFGESRDVGIYNAAARTANLMNFLLVSVNTIAAPKFAELFHKGDKAGLKSTAQESTKLIFWFSLPVFIIVIFSSGFIMGIFGEQFRDGAVILVLLVTAQLVNVSTGSVGYLLMMCNFEKLLRDNILAVAIINVIFGIIFIPKYGMMGAAMVSGFSLILQNAISLVLVKRKLNFWTIPLLEKLENRFHD